MNVEHEGSFLQALTTGCNLFLGSGFSVLAADGNGRPMPVGDQLADELRNEFALDGGRALDLSELTTIIAADRASELDSYLRKRFSVGNFSTLYKALFRLKVETIFTTNVDDLIHILYSKSADAYLNDMDYSGTAPAGREAIDLVMLHGSIRNKNRPLRFGSLELAEAFSSDPDRWMYFRQRLQKLPTLFWGYSLRDSGTLQAIRSIAPSGPTLGDAWFQVRPADRTHARVDYLRALNFRICFAETDELLKFVEASVTRNATPITLSDRVRSMRNIPDPSQVPQRPIEDFFLGAPPAWNHIFSNTLVKTAHYRKIEDSIASRQPLIITGIPATGKTTLLMQLAANVNFPGPVIMEANLSDARAKLIARQLAGEPGLVFIDNVTNDIDAFGSLIRTPGVVVIAADRDYNIGTVSNRLESVEVLKITDLPRSDLQSIWAAIPPRLRATTHTNWPVMSRGVTPSLFEFIVSNVKGKPLAEQLVMAVRELNGEDPELAELLVLACYVHNCRTPLSMDTVIGFMAGQVPEYREIYALLERVGDLLHEYDGELAEEPQDYFSARSMLVAETVLDGIPGSILKRVLRKFHHNVSPVRVAAYDTFKRRAYDSRLFLRAFPNTEEGVTLYDWIVDRHGTAYVLQQKALFLAERKEFTDAFQSIDKARGEVRGTNWTIENSYNKILFRANYDKAHSYPEARELLDRALQGLVECFQHDRRKGMHALVYGDCAVAYATTFKDTVAVEVLTTAREQLEETRKLEPYLDRPGHLLREINKAFRDVS